MLKGTLLAESLRVGAEVYVAGLRLTRVSRRDVSGSVSPTQPSMWAFLDFEGEDGVAESLAGALAQALLADGGWYANFTVGDECVVVYAGRVFQYRRGDQAKRAEAVEYGKAVGVPIQQLDWAD